jgi:hypothetical protein
MVHSSDGVSDVVFLTPGCAPMVERTCGDIGAEWFGKGTGAKTGGCNKEGCGEDAASAAAAAAVAKPSHKCGAQGFC